MGERGRGRREGQEKNTVEPLVLYSVLRKREKERDKEREREREREEGREGKREEEATDHTDLVSATVYQDSPGQRQAAVLR